MSRARRWPRSGRSALRKITPELLAQIKAQAGGRSAAPLDEATAGLYDELMAAQAEQQGITPNEGAQVFARLLGGVALPQIIVSTGDVRQTIARIGALTTASLLERLARRSRPLNGHAAALDPATLPAGAIEQQVIAIWRQVLGVEQVGLNDNFFELGGTSLLGIQVIAELKAAFGVEIPAVSIFEAPTVGALVRQLQPSRQPQTFDHSRERARKRGHGLSLFKGEKQ